MGNTLTRENVEAAFQSILAEFGADHLYERQSRTLGDSNGCYYTLPTKHEGEYVPSCIVGQIIDRVDHAALQVIGELEAETNLSCGAYAVLDGVWSSWSDEDGNAPEEERQFTEDETLIRALDRAQGVQDDRGTWGEAYEAYREFLEGRYED